VTEVRCRSWTRFGNSSKGSDETLAVREGYGTIRSSVELSGGRIYTGNPPVLAIKRLAWSCSGMPLMSNKQSKGDVELNLPPIDKSTRWSDDEDDAPPAE
jgi:hypothetical protein